MVLFAINHFQTPTLRKLICQLLLESHFCHTFVNSFGIPLLPEAGSIGNILSCHIVTNKPNQIVNIFLLISAFQHPWLRGFSSLVGRIHLFSLLTFISIASSLFLQLFPPRHSFHPPSPMLPLSTLSHATPLSPPSPPSPSPSPSIMEMVADK